MAKKEPRSSLVKSRQELSREVSPTPSPQFLPSAIRTDVRMKFLLKTKFPLTYPVVKEIDVMKQFGGSQMQPLEKFLKNIRIKTSYLKTKTGKPKTTVLTIRVLGHMREPKIDEKGLQKVEDQKVKWNSEVDSHPGNATNLGFLRDPGEMISVKEYFVESKSPGLQAKL